MQSIYEKYMFDQPILIKIININHREAVLKLGVGGEEIEVLFKNSLKRPPMGPGILTYNSIMSDDLDKYAIDVAFTNSGKVHEIRKIYKDVDLEPMDVKEYPRFDMMHSSNIIRST